MLSTTVNLDHQLLGEAPRLTGMTEPNALIHHGLRALIQHGSVRRLSRLEAAEPAIRVPSRRRTRHRTGG